MRNRSYFLRMGRGGFTLVELVMSMALATVILGAIVIASITLQKTFQASEDYTTGMAAQLRALDYIALDCRRAITVGQTADHILDLTIPNYYDTSDPSAPVPRNPTLPPTAKTASGVPLYYGTSTIAVNYRQVGTDIVRTYDGVQKVIVSNVRNVKLTPTTISDPNITVTINFLPNYHRGSSATVDDATQAVTTQTAKILMRNSQKITLE